MKYFIAKLKAIFRLLFASGWVVVTINRDKIYSFADLTPTEAEEVTITMVDLANKVIDKVETEKQEEININHANQIANGLN